MVRFVFSEPRVSKKRRRVHPHARERPGEHLDLGRLLSETHEDVRELRFHLLGHRLRELALRGRRSLAKLPKQRLARIVVAVVRRGDRRDGAGVRATMRLATAKPQLSRGAHHVHLRRRQLIDERI